MTLEEKIKNLKYLRSCVNTVNKLIDESPSDPFLQVSMVYHLEDLKSQIASLEKEIEYERKKSS